jgi:hypothetical protein
VNLPKASDIAMLARFLRSLDKKFKILLRTKLLSGLDLFFIFKIGKIQAKKSDLLGERKSKQASKQACRQANCSDESACNNNNTTVRSKAAKRQRRERERERERNQIGMGSFRASPNPNFVACDWLPKTTHSERVCSLCVIRSHFYF